ncbi:hypothetical protein FOL46_007342 [Perkinsus olseni]|uniref:Dynactin subunit 5 n=1 Tax=Perkinsus olseni TaxID=32597 RepID=A0A7J6LEG3_PEROL|nr:hypothetical protein FOL46_007342 [Perkinsus olseni]
MSGSTCSAAAESVSLLLPAPVWYEKGTYLESSTSGNKICRHFEALCPQNIRIGGRSIVHKGCVLHGDLGRIECRKWVVLGDDVVLMPCSPANRLDSGASRQQQHYDRADLFLGEYVHVGPRTVVKAASIGNYVRIEEDCCLGEGCVVKGHSVILAGTKVPPRSTVPPFHIVGPAAAAAEGREGFVLLAELPPAWERAIADQITDMYYALRPGKPN